ncbi:MAG: DUF853 family protein, partial [Clostridiales bacterium]|nr:DUF853 family protein [Clostridiales bacterium]
QAATDIPESVLGQLGNRIQHALRAYTPKDQKTVRTTAQTFRQNPDLDIESVITELAVGEALVSFLDEEGVPSVVQRVWVLPPKSAFGPADDEAIKQVIANSPMGTVYDTEVDRESAYEVLVTRAKKTDIIQAELELKQQQEMEKNERGKALKAAEKKRKAEAKEMDRKLRKFKSSVFGKTLSSAGTTIGREFGKKLIRGLFGSLK